MRICILKPTLALYYDIMSLGKGESRHVLQAEELQRSSLGFLQGSIAIIVVFVYS